MFDITELNAKKVDELKTVAKELSVPGFNKLKKEDLVYQILDAQAEQAPIEQPKPVSKPKAPKPKAVKVTKKGPS
jgi:transcription termination factor Rho